MFYIEKYTCSTPAKMPKESVCLLNVQYSMLLCVGVGVLRCCAFQWCSDAKTPLQTSICIHVHTPPQVLCSE